MEKNLNFNDITLVPRQISMVESRDSIKISIPFNNEINLTAPIVSAPMKDVTNGSVAHKIRELGGLGVIHRFMSIQDQCNEYNSAQYCACAIGVNNDYLDRFKSLYDLGCRLFCIDTANGANYRVQQVIEQISKYSVDLIVGNVATKECYHWLEQFPIVKAIRVGIAGGAACTTKIATGINYGMVSSIMECAEVKTKTLLIADGGIKTPADLCKSIALGADAVMLGGLIANTVESPAEVVRRDKIYKIYRGSASFDIQKEYRDKARYVEGTVQLLEHEGESLELLITRFTDGLKSCMSYFNATNFEEFRKNVSFAKG